MNLYRKLFANKIQEQDKNIIHHNMVAFIPEMQGMFYKWKLINKIYHMNILKIKPRQHFVRYSKVL